MSSRKPFTARPNAWPACAKCGSLQPLARHHVYPVAYGGLDEPWNLVWLCSAPAGGCHRTWHELRRSKALRGKGHRHAARVFAGWLRMKSTSTSTATKC